MPPKNGTFPAIAPSVAPPIPPVPARSLSQLTREYVSGGGYSWYSNALARTLPWAIDDITADFGDDVYERMLFDYQVAAVVNAYKASILEDGITLAPAIKDETDPLYAQAVEIRDEAEAMLNDLSTPLDDVLWNMLDCAPFGHKVAEQVYEYRQAVTTDRWQYQLRALKVKSRRATAFVVDAYLEVIGLLVQFPGMPAATIGHWLIEPKDAPPNLLPRQNFALATFRPRDSDPRGTSILRPAFDPWWRKHQVLPEYLKYLAQFAGPSLIGYTPEQATNSFATDSLGGYNPDPNAPPLPTPEEIMNAALISFRNGTATTFPFGSEVQVIAMQGEGQAFLSAIDACDRQITKAILSQELATEEGQHQSRAASQVHQDVMDTMIRQGKRSTVRWLAHDVLRPWVAFNYPEDAHRLVPIPSLGKVEQQDQASTWTAAASLYSSGYLHDSQLPGMDEALGLPARDLTSDQVDEGQETDGAPTGAQAAQGAQDGATGITEPSGAQAGTPPAQDGSEAQPVPPTRIPVRAHSRVRPAPRTPSAGFAETFTPEGADTTLAALPTRVRFSEDERAALASRWNALVPTAAGLLSAETHEEPDAA